MEHVFAVLSGVAAGRISVCPLFDEAAEAARASDAARGIDGTEPRAAADLSGGTVEADAAWRSFGSDSVAAGRDHRTAVCLAVDDEPVVASVVRGAQAGCGSVSSVCAPRTTLAT